MAKDDLGGKFGRPDPNTVREFHINSDADVSPESIHHTIGPGVNQSASGAHRHDGNDSPLLGEDIAITGAKGGNTALASIIAFLVQTMGATDSTT